MLSLIRLVAEMLLPEGNMRRMSDVIVGLILMLGMLQALKDVLHGGFFE